MELSLANISISWNDLLYVNKNILGINIIFWAHLHQIPPDSRSSSPAYLDPARELHVCEGLPSVGNMWDISSGKICNKIPNYLLEFHFVGVILDAQRAPLVHHHFRYKLSNSLVEVPVKVPRHYSHQRINH